MKGTKQKLGPAAAGAALLVCGLAPLLAGGAESRVPALLSAGGALVGVILLVRLYADLTRSREREVQLLEEREALEALERRHSQELEECRAGTRKEMGHFRDSLAHSLRMPLAVIQGYAELLAGGMVDSEATSREYLEKIIHCSQDMSEAVSRHFSQTESPEGKRLSYTEFDLLALVGRVAADMQVTAREQEVLIQVVSPERTMPIQGDAHHISRVLFNLLENALKYMGRPGTVTIRLLDRGESYEILVQDDGLGLPAREVPRVFEPNFQGSNRGEGRGYGLFQVQQSVLAHGGTISARSDLGQGMGITIRLPKKPEEEPDHSLRNF